MEYMVKKLKSKRVLVAQVIIVLLAFAALVMLSYFLVGRGVQQYVERTTMSVLDFGEAQIVASIREPNTAINLIADIFEEMINSGYSEAELYEFILSRTNHILSYDNPLVSSKGLFSVVHIDGHRNFFLGSQWNLPDDFDPTLRPWYEHSIAHINERQVMQTSPYIEYLTGENIISFIRNIFDTRGQRIGVIGFDVNVSHVTEFIENRALGWDSFGMLIDRDLDILAHYNPLYIGQNLADISYGLYEHLSDFYTCGLTPGTRIQHDSGHEYMAFVRCVGDDWIFVILVPYSVYHESARLVAMRLGQVGFGLALFIIVVLVLLDRRRVVAEIRDYNKSLFLANMSHEIRNPLNVIRGMTTIALRSDTLEKMRDCLVRIEASTYHLLGVVNDTLDMSKIEANNFDLIDLPFDTSLFINKIVNSSKSLAEEKGVKFILLGEKSLPTRLIGDEVRLTQVVINLISNAIKFTPADGTVTLKIQTIKPVNDGYTLYFEVMDTGIGIEEEIKESLFEAFVQADTGSIKQYAGAGLGLSICKYIITLMGGSIGVESEVGEGSTFWFEVKMNGEESPSIDHDGHRKERVYNWENKRILLAEDMEVNKEVVCALLEDTNVTIDWAENGEIAVSMVKESQIPYDLILMDLWMPVMDGLAATEEIKSIVGRSIPVIALTANVMKEEIDKCKAVGMSDHIGKPVDMMELLSKLSFYLD